jgi:hypothetical protein
MTPGVLDAEHGGFFMRDATRHTWFALFIALILVASAGVIVATEDQTSITGQVDGAQPAVPPVEPQLTPASCTGSIVPLTPFIPPPNFGADAAQHERGVFITAIEDFHVCNIGYKLDLVALPITLFVRIYAANGTTRGALLAENSIPATTVDHVVHFVPIDHTLEACQDYEITMIIPATAAWEWWSDLVIPEPFDAAGVIRVRDGASDGNPTNFALPHFEIIGQALSPEGTDLAGPGPSTGVSTNQLQARGVYVKALDTAQMSAFGWEADLDAGGILTARVYEAVGTVRGALIASGTYTVLAAGTQWHDVPINVQLVEGKEYNFSIQFGLTNSWNWWNEAVIVTPYDREIIQVVTGEQNGDPTNFALPHYRVGWDEKTGGVPFNLAKTTDVFPPPFSAPDDNLAYGAFVTSVIDQEIYGLGWMADVPEGEAITARVYEAVGNVRGALISEGTAYSTGDGMRFHDIPVAATLGAADDYDFEIEFDFVTEWRWWDDMVGMPYTSYGVLTVRTGESFGDPDNFALLHIRMHACGELLTPVDRDDPARTPMFLATPAPNPVSAMSRLDFALEEDGPVSIVVYDVAGRRVTTLLDGQRPKGWHSVELDSGTLASGVYFLKMQTKMKSVSRKFVITH